jgi:hypothetical protein
VNDGVFFIHHRIQVSERQMVVAKHKRNVVDELASRLRGLLEDFDRLLSPQPHAKPVRVPVPIPVRPERRRRLDDPYR